MAYKKRRNKIHSSVKIVVVHERSSWRDVRKVLITHNSNTRTAYEWSNRTGMNYGTILARVYAGWSANEIFDTPVANRKYDRRGRKIIRNNPKSSYECVPRKIIRGVHPVMREILLAMRQQSMTYQQMHQRSGVSYSAQLKHKRGHMGLFTNVEAMANAVGLKIVATKKKLCK